MYGAGASNDRHWYQDLNSIPLIWIRWIFFGNQLFWLFIQFAATADHTLRMVSYGLGVFPVIFLTTIENWVHLQSELVLNGLNQREWAWYRITSNVITIAFLCIWLGVEKIGLIIAAWIFSAMIILSENSNSCYYNRCSGFAEYQTI